MFVLEVLRDALGVFRFDNRRADEGACGRSATRTPKVLESPRINQARRVAKQHAASGSKLYTGVADKNRCSPICVVEHLQADQSSSQVGYRAFDHYVNLDAILLANEGVAVEIERHRLAGIDRSAERSDDVTVVVEEFAAVDDKRTVTSIQDVDPDCLPEGYPDWATALNNECLSRGCAEREKAQQEGDEE